MLVRALSITLLATAFVACAPHDVDETGPSPKTLTPEFAPEPNPFPGPDPVEGPDEVRQMAQASISSVHVMNDCPPPPAQPIAGAAESRSQPHPGVAGDQDLRYSGCMGSSMQMAFTAHTGPGRVVVRSIRMYAADNRKRSLSRPSVHTPMRWNESGGYEAWDMRLPQGHDTQATFQVYGFDWQNVEQAMSSRKRGASSWGQLFVLEADVEIDGVVQTVRSPEFTRDNPDMVVT